ncbi:unnamed protein product [Sphagnum jensenii]|uniref:DNA-directed RNA polymerase III subunit RPC6 n=1 Tax=Sphagnum jensenii TaxID=128206 RepID=A0ABP1BUF0_9BRYO
MASRLGATINKILDLCRAHSQGLPQKVLDEELQEVEVEIIKQSLNFLLQKQKLQVFMQGESIVYREQDTEAAAKFKGLTSEDMLVYQAIQQAANTGIWTADLKKRTNLQQLQVNKALKNLESRSLVKPVKTVSNKNRKVYMLFELDPSREVTGGAWYTEQDYDAEFVDVVKQQCLHFILKQGLASLEDVAESVRKSGITQVELRLEEFKQILDTLVLDGDIEEVVGGAPSSSHAPVSFETVCYRASRSRIPETSALTSVPCGICPVLRECRPDGLISPQTCIYFKDWLTF